MEFTHSPQWEFSIPVEQLVQYLLLQDGHSILQTSASTNRGAPMVCSLKGNQVVLDLLSAKDGITQWDEVKGKRRTVKYGKSQTHRTGAPDGISQTIGKSTRSQGADVDCISYTPMRSTLSPA